MVCLTMKADGIERKWVEIFGGTHEHIPIALVIMTTKIQKKILMKSA